MHFNFLIRNHYYLTQGKHDVRHTFSNTRTCRKLKETIQHDQSCQWHALGSVPEGLLNDIFSLIYYFLQCEQFHVGVFNFTVSFQSSTIKR